jgi:hypothetical protein
VSASASSSSTTSAIQELEIERKVQRFRTDMSEGLSGLSKRVTSV